MARRKCAVPMGLFGSGNGDYNPKVGTSGNNLGRPAGTLAWAVLGGQRPGRLGQAQTAVLEIKCCT